MLAGPGLGVPGTPEQSLLEFAAKNFLLSNHCRKTVWLGKKSLDCLMLLPLGDTDQRKLSTRQDLKDFTGMQQAS